MLDICLNHGGIEMAQPVFPEALAHKKAWIERRDRASLPHRLNHLGTHCISIQMIT